MGQCDDAAFAGCVGFRVGLGLKRACGGDVDDRATWTSADEGQGVFRAEEPVRLVPMMRFHCASESDSSAPVSGLLMPALLTSASICPKCCDTASMPCLTDDPSLTSTSKNARHALSSVARVPLSIEHRHVEITRGKAPRDGRADTLCAAGHGNASAFHQDSPRDGRYGSKKANRCRLAFVQFRGM